MNINIMLLSFVILGLMAFQTIFISEMAEAEQEELPVTQSFIESIIGAFVTPSVNITAISSCDGFLDCSEAFYHAAVDFVLALVIIIYDVVLAVALLVAILLFPIPEAPIIINVIFYALKIGGIVALIAIIKPGGNG